MRGDIVKNWSLKAALTILSVSSVVACSAETEINKRGERGIELQSYNNGLIKKAADAKAAVGSGNVDPNTGAPGTGTGPVTSPIGSVEIPEIKMPGLKLATDAVLADIESEVILVSKVNATDFMIFGAEGKAWLYKPSLAADDRLKVVKREVVNLVGSTLYTLPDNEFWYVSESKLSRLKEVSDSGKVISEDYSTGALKGDKTKMKVLYVSKEEIILHLDTHISILTVLPGIPAKHKQIEIAKIPVDLKGEIHAGRSTGGYWFKSAAGLTFLSSAVTDAPWSKSAFAIDPADMSSIAMIPDEANLNFIGESLGLSAAGLFSDVVPK